MKTIIIIGGGFAGATLAKCLMRRLPRDCQVFLISEDSYTTFHPLLPELVGATIFPEHVVAPLRQVIGLKPHGRFVMGRVNCVDLAQRTIACTTLLGEQTFAYDHLVLAVGCRARLDLVPGMAENALPLKTVGDAQHIRNIVLRRVARMELESDAETRRRLGGFIVIGGGFSGVEVGGALADFLRGLLRYYPRVSRSELKVTLLQDNDRLLPELPPSLGEAARRSLARRGVEIRLGARAARIEPDAVILTDGDRLPAGTVIATIGTRPNALTEAMGLAAERGRIRVGPSLEVEGASGIWAIGDCALAVNAATGAPCPPTAQFAVRQAEAAARNIAAALRGEAPVPFAYVSRGAMAAIGHLSGVGKISGIQVTGLIAWLMWRVYYLTQMQTLARKLRLFGEWSWGMLFPTDITHLHFARSIDLAPQNREGGGASSSPPAWSSQP